MQRVRLNLTALIQICEMSCLVSKLANMNFSPFFLKGKGLASASESLHLSRADGNARGPVSTALFITLPGPLSVLKLRTYLLESQACSSIPLVLNWVGKPDLVLLFHSYNYLVFMMWRAKAGLETWEHPRWAINLSLWAG